MAFIRPSSQQVLPVPALASALLDPLDPFSLRLCDPPPSSSPALILLWYLELAFLCQSLHAY